MRIKLISLVIVLSVLLTPFLQGSAPVGPLSETTYTLVRCYTYISGGLSQWRHCGYFYYTWRTGDGWVKAAQNPARTFIAYQPGWYYTLDSSAAHFANFGTIGEAWDYIDVRHSVLGYCINDDMDIFPEADLTPPNWSYSHIKYDGC